MPVSLPTLPLPPMLNPTHNPMTRHARLQGERARDQVPDQRALRPAARARLELAQRAAGVAQRECRLRLHHAQRVAVGPARGRARGAVAGPAPPRVAPQGGLGQLRQVRPASNLDNTLENEVCTLRTRSARARLSSTAAAADRAWPRRPARRSTGGPAGARACS